MWGGVRGPARAAGRLTPAEGTCMPRPVTTPCSLSLATQCGSPLLPDRPRTRRAFPIQRDRHPTVCTCFQTSSTVLRDLPARADACAPSRRLHSPTGGSPPPPKELHWQGSACSSAGRCRSDHETGRAHQSHAEAKCLPPRSSEQGAVPKAGTQLACLPFRTPLQREASVTVMILPQVHLRKPCYLSLIHI